MLPGTIRATAPGDGPGEPPPSWPRRIGWLVLIWAVSVAALASAAIAIRLLMNLAGLAL